MFEYFELKEKKNIKNPLRIYIYYRFILYYVIFKYRFLIGVRETFCKKLYLGTSIIFFLSMLSVEHNFFSVNTCLIIFYKCFFMLVNHLFIYVYISSI